jgi:flagellar hook-associated protein 2
MAESTLFTGASRYAADFQGLIERAVGIASLPLKQLQSVRTSLRDQSSALEQLQRSFESLRSALDGLKSVTGTGGYTTAVSNGAVLSASVGAGAMTGVWSVEVTSLGAWTSTLSKDGLPRVSDPATQSITSATSLTLRVNGESKQITPASATLTALVEAINEAGLEVEASIVNVGTTSAPDYRLAVRSTKLAAVTIELEDEAGALLDTLALGSPATYKVNGMSQAIESDSRTVTLAPGLDDHVTGNQRTRCADNRDRIALDVGVEQRPFGVRDGIQQRGGRAGRAPWQGRRRAGGPEHCANVDRRAARADPL